jgi:UDP-N-acetyl-alpha-D-quinovosamine dehydrogenase
VVLTLLPTSGRGPVVVTGAGGFIGHALCTQLPARGWPVRGLVRALDRHTAARAEYLPVGDLALLTDRVLAHILRGACAVVHLAARVHVAGSADGSSLAAYRRVNVAVTQRIARAAAAAGITHFVFASTVKVHGETTLPGRAFVESDPPNPYDDYATSKWEAERELDAVARESGMRVTALRLPLTYGPQARANFARLARAVRRGWPLPLGGIANRRSLLGVDNLVDAVAVLLASDSDPGSSEERGRMTPYLLADRTAVSTPDLVRAIAAAQSVAPWLVAVPAGLLRVAGACTGRAAAVARLTETLEVDTDSFRTRFGWMPPVSLSQGLAAACANVAPL